MATTFRLFDANGSSHPNQIKLDVFLDVANPPVQTALSSAGTIIVSLPGTAPLLLRFTNQSSGQSVDLNLRTKPPGAVAEKFSLCLTV